MELTGLEFRLQAVLPVAPPVERTDEAFLVDPKGGGLKLAGPDRPLDAAVVVRMSHVDPELFPPYKTTWFRKVMHAVGRFFFVRKVRKRKGVEVVPKCYLR